MSNAAASTNASFSVTSKNIGIANTGAGVLAATNIGIGSGSAAGPEQAAPAPPGWTVYKIHHGFNQRSEVHESPVSGKAVYISSLNIDNACGRFHWNVYRNLHPDIEFLHAGIAALGANVTTISNVIFTDPIDHAKFEDWLLDYSKKFRSRENLYSFHFPPPPSKLRAMLPLPWVHKAEQTVEVAVWLLRQCIHPVYALGDVFLFQNEQDAVAYKIKFS